MIKRWEPSIFRRARHAEVSRRAQRPPEAAGCGGSTAGQSHQRKCSEQLFDKRVTPFRCRFLEKLMDHSSDAAMTRLGRYPWRFKKHLKTSHSAPFARLSADTLSPKIDVAESKDAIDVTADCRASMRRISMYARQWDVDRPRPEKDRARRAGQG
jgi:hypothetical protein